MFTQSWVEKLTSVELVVERHFFASAVNVLKKRAFSL
jgi:hypothetical protein